MLCKAFPKMELLWCKQKGTKERSKQQEEMRDFSGLLAGSQCGKEEGNTNI